MIKQRSAPIASARRRVVVLVGISFVTVALAGIVRAETTVTPPKYQSLRYEEDWSVLRNGSTGDAFDPFKYMPLSSNGRIWASFAGQLRERVEMWNDFNFGAPTANGNNDDDSYLLQRLRASVDVHAGDMFRVFVEGKSALSTDRDLPGGVRPVEEDTIALQNGFVDLRLPLGADESFTVRAGRQELLFGNERLVSPLDWTNTRRTFDAVSGIWNAFGWRVQAFYAALVRIHKYNANEPDNDVQFWGAYATRPLPFGAGGPAVLDLYWLALERGDSPNGNNPGSGGFNGAVGEDDRQTFGARIAGPIPGTDFDYEAEGAYQFGDVSGADVSAGMLTAEVGWGLPKTALAPRVVGGLDYASGDDKAGDGDVQTFNQLFPLGHKYLGYIDVVGRQNIVDARVQTGCTPFWATRVSVDLHNFWRASNEDALYNVNGNVVRAGNLSNDSYVGSELDLTLRRPFGRHFEALVGYSHFFAGTFIDDSGADDDIDFGYIQGQYTF